MNLRERVQAVQTELSAIADAVSGVPTHGPGIAPVAAPAPSSASWLDNPGTLYEGNGPFDPSFDNIPECLRRAAQCINPNGSRAWRGDDAVKALALARYISDPVRTYQEVEGRLVGAGKNPAVAAFALCVGWAQGFPASMGAPTLFTVAGLIGDLCSAQGTSTPSGKPA